MFRKNEDIIYLEIADKSILLTKCYKINNLLNLDPNSRLQITLENNEIKDGVLFNPTLLNQTISNFIKKEKIQNPTFLISATYLTENANLNLQLLQLLAALKPIKGFITQICNEKIFKNDNKISMQELQTYTNLLENFYPPKNSDPRKWIAYTSFALTIFLSINIFRTLANNNTLQTVKNKALQIESENKKIETDLKNFKVVKTKNITLKSLKSKINNNVSCYTSCLKTISKTIPHNCWITNLKINEISKKSETHSFSLTLNGQSSSKSEIAIFLENLNQTKIFKTLSLQSIQKKNNCYQFEFLANS
ncbi:TPA: hypothetical protein DEO28_04280 [Candidatus Dependentiae bacterium]|nr:MAG: hypothetical protein UR14_C0006G0093 [candidate division TM6 bacterium GW2011_GWE2_31_21]KKP53484.1 MAG: hypothetical protein UR43_C0004G0025 [candidate division TM6 bacterium GW2011_GWF2_33_332]HBS48274.1 hypothetical protein [Candidatus Dependentiae bacterium]HBZ73701.1 hypothetical protein [Candidatus Dependentiae bacterium]